MEKPGREWNREIPGGERQDVLSGTPARRAPGTSLLQAPEEPRPRIVVTGL